MAEKSTKQSFNFSPTKQKPYNKNIYGFDIETYNNNKKFLCASIYKDDEHNWMFRDKQKMIDFFKHHKFRSSIVSATNLGFDFHGLYFGSDEALKHRLQYRGSDLLSAKTYITQKGELSFKSGSGKCPITFIDTLNYAKLSVEKMGSLLGIPKLETPDFIGKKPKTKSDWQIMEEYNMRDSKISKLGLEFLYKAFYDLGANCKSTIASTSMSLFRNKFLTTEYKPHSFNERLTEFNAYYGGRTEAFARGKIKNYNYYDFNSLYPSVMMYDFPDPNTLRKSYKNTLLYIEEFEGISNVDVEFYEDDASIPKAYHYPLLPLRHDNKLLFPTGKFSGWYSHSELREAFKLGYRITRVKSTYYFEKTCSPFREFVTFLYEKRKDYQAENNPMEYVTKILLNSLYGKFAQKFTDKDEWKPFNLTLEELNKLKDFERVGDFIRIKKAFSRPAVFCFPIWSLQTTSYARLKMHDYILRSNPVYCDTDSIITKKEFPTSKELGKLKLEMRIKEGCIVKPKFYALKPLRQKEYVKAKGVGVRLSMQDFWSLLDTRKVSYNKFMKFKESIRRGFIPNEIQEITKQLDLEDSKRVWNSTFNQKELQYSRPVQMKNNLTKEVIAYNTI